MTSYHCYMKIHGQCHFLSIDFSNPLLRKHINSTRSQYCCTVSYIKNNNINPLILTLPLARYATFPTFLGIPGLRDPVDSTEPADIWRRRRPFLGDTESVCDERLRLCRDWDGRTSSEDFRDDDEAEEALEN